MQIQNSGYLCKGRESDRLRHRLPGGFKGTGNIQS